MARRKPTGRKPGRPRIDIDWEQMDKLCGIQATLREIAAWFDCSEDTIEAACKRDKGQRFAEYFAAKSSPGKISLRRKQYEVAMSGDKTMLIWLGKQWLGQSDKLERKDELRVDPGSTDVLAKIAETVRRRRAEGDPMVAEIDLQ